MKNFCCCFLLIAASFLLFVDRELYAQKNASYFSNSVTVREVIDEISKDSVRSIIQTLQSFTTRYMGNNNRQKIYKWIVNKFISFGFTDVEIDSFICNASSGMGLTMQYNVVAKIKGSVRPNEYYIIGGHYDSYSSGNLLDAPGADDNASGTAAVLESARVIKKKNYQPGSSLLFIAFAAEEIMSTGYAGCQHYAQAARTGGMDIKLMINNDMIAYSPYSPEQSQVRINYYTHFEYLKDFAQNMTRTYTKLTPSTGSINQYSDSQAFYSQNYPSVYFEEKTRSPNYHESTDLLDYCNIPYCTEVIKASCATLLSYQETAVEVEKEKEIPAGFILAQNYPNPFNPSTIISFTLPRQSKVTLKIYDLSGKELDTVFNGYKDAGTHKVSYDASKLSSGRYFYELKAGDAVITKKMIYQK